MENLARLLSIPLMLFFVLHSPSLQAQEQASQAGIKSIADFKAFMASRPDIRHLEDVLPFMDSSVWQNAELMHRSHSVQGASFRFPRAINFNEAGFVIAFNGDPSQEGYNSLELMEFVTDPRPHFIVHRHLFPEDTERMLKSGFDRKDVLRNINCANCHREDVRPNWDTYDIVPNTLSSSFTLGPNDPRVKAFAEFNATKKQHPRYRFVEQRENGRSFGRIFSDLNHLRIADKIARHPRIAEFKYALLAAFGGCESIESFLPKVMVSQTPTYNEVYLTHIVTAKAYVERKIDEDILDRDAYLLYMKQQASTWDPTRKAEHIKAVGQETWEVIYEQGILHPRFAEHYSSESSAWEGEAQLRYLAQRMGMDMSDWSLAFDRNAYAFREGGNDFLPSRYRPAGNTAVGKDSMFMILARRLELDLQKVMDPPQEDWEIGRVNCQNLRTLSLEALGAGAEASGPHVNPDLNKGDSQSEVKTGEESSASSQASAK